MSSMVRAEIEGGAGEVYCSLMFDTLSDLIGSVFEEITRQYLRRMNALGKLPFVAKSFGKWWGKGKKGEPQEIDIVVESIAGKELIIGECKWKNSLKVHKTTTTLCERASYFDKYKSYKYLFTKNPIDIKEEQGVVNVAAEEYFLQP